jgi:hypothetical protein
MRYHLFLQYGWFLQNLGKYFIPTNMHTTVLTINIYTNFTSFNNFKPAQPKQHRRKLEIREKLFYLSKHFCDPVDDCGSDNGTKINIWFSRGRWGSLHLYSLAHQSWSAGLICRTIQSQLSIILLIKCLLLLSSCKSCSGTCSGN